MKKYNLLYTALTLLTVFFASCEDMLTEKPNSSYDKDGFFSTEAKADMAIMGIYNSISDYRHYGYYEMAAHASDDTYYLARTGSDNQICDMVHYTTSSTNEWVKWLWALKYQGIDRANMTISGIQGMDGYGENKNLYALEGEARFLRAFLAFDLVKYWGDVPFKTDYSSGYDDAFGGRVNRELIYDQIIEDLNFAKSNLEWATAASSPERATQGAARALLMRVWLQRAGYSLQQNGQMTRPDDATRKRYFEAVLNEWEEIQKNGYHDFYDGGYEALFKSYSEGVLNSKESIFEIAFFHQQGSRNGGAWGIYNGPQVAEPTGISPTEANNYMGRANGFFITVPEWKAFFEESDARRDVSICTYRYTWANNQHTKQERSAGSWYPGKWRREWMTPETRNKNMNYGDVNLCVLRYADVVLMAAEAYNETGSTPEAWRLLNNVRQRAGATAYTDANYEELMAARKKTHALPFISDGDAQGKFRTALYWERGFELSFEGQRKFDLIRWGVLADALKLFGEKSSVNKKDNKPYPAYQNFVTGKHELLPIPLAEIQSNPKLEGKNNNGY
ncbi:RagB/SusD family nutrient uptake outer membrane protein [Bacteroides fluxus]|uniref:RagB/SusD family nutrient uptake outer membrane protein n=1 Tax=Bacteroides fluxus TaxID=626930 RepID=UPI0023A876C7|nr:RagB/SusD family nutrient uptake outer membrane protein [Bacteroides fluxus]